jgi:hypothetical protein
VLQQRGIDTQPTDAATPSDASLNRVGSFAAVVTRELAHLINAIAGVLIFNKQTVEEGFDAFDADDDGVISVGDVVSTASALEIDTSNGRLAQELVAAFDADGDGALSRTEWGRALDGADGQKFLDESGGGSAEGAEGAEEGVAHIVDAISAIVKFNELTVDEAYDIFADAASQRVTAQTIAAALADSDVEFKLYGRGGGGCSD